MITNNRTKAYIMTACALAAGRLAASEVKPVIPDAVKDHIRKRVEPGDEFGIVVGMVGEEGATFFAHGAAAKGEAKLDEDSVFEIGSISKAFTAMLLADAVIRGDVKLDDPVAKLLPPSVKMPEHGGKPITFEHLATHRSGLPRVPGNMMPKDDTNPYADYTAEKMYEFLSEYALSADPPAAYAYSNFGAGLLGHVLALKAGKSYDALVRERICGPLDMKHTACIFTPEMKKHLAHGHAAGRPAANWDLDALAGAGAIRSTARDMTTFLAACMVLSDDKLAPIMAMCLGPRYSTGIPGIAVALGWHIDNKHGTDIIWHNGGTGGYHSFCGFRTDKKVGVVVLTNNSDDIDDIGRHLLAPNAPLSTQRTAATVDPAALDDYLGYYQLAPGVLIHITRDGDALFAQLTGQDRFPIFPEAKDKFFFKVVDAQLTFVRDDVGKVAKVMLHQGGIDQTAERLPPGQEPKPRVEVKVAPETLTSYVGRYQLGPVTFDVKLDGEKLTVQLTGQPRFQVFPESETKFFYKVVEAQITFVKGADGKVGSLILHQGGIDQTANRIEN